MIVSNPYREHPVRFHEALQDLTTLGFSAFSTWLEILDISQNQMNDYFIIDYYDAWTLYNNSVIPGIIQRVASENAKKYDKLCAIYQAEYNPLNNYDRTEEIEEVRTPDITREHSGSASSTTTGSAETDTERKQTKTITENGGNYEATDIRSVAPFDSSTFNNAEKNTSSFSGSRTTSEAYSGQPDHLESESSSTISAEDSKTETETGTETTTREAHISGNIGTVTSQDLANQELDLAERMNIFKIIEKDIAKALFLQIW